MSEVRVPWKEPGLTVEDRADRLAKIVLDYYNNETDESCDQAIVAALRAARSDAIEEAAMKLETMHFLFTLQRPGTGPFTRQDITMREVIEQDAAALRDLKGATS